MLAVLEAAAESHSFWAVGLGDVIQVGVAGIMLVAVYLSWRSAEAAEEGVKVAERSADAAWDSVRTAEDAIRAEIISALAEEFWSSEYHQACTDLSEFFELEPGTWLEDWKRQVRRFKWFLERETPSERMEAVNRARRRVKGYYHRIWQLTRADLLDVEQVREELSPERNLPILFRTVEPLECAVTEGYDPKERGELYRFFAEEVCPDEELYRPVPEEGCPSFSEEGYESSSS